MADAALWHQRHGYAARGGCAAAAAARPDVAALLAVPQHADGDDDDDDEDEDEDGRSAAAVAPSAAVAVAAVSCCCCPARIYCKSQAHTLLVS